MAPPVKPSLGTIVLGVCVSAIIAAGFYLFHNTPATDGLVQDQQRELAERDRITAEPRTNRERSVESPQHANGSGSQSPLSTEDGKVISKEIVALQERLEATMQRLDQRLSQMEERLLQAKLIPMTREQREVVEKGTRRALARLRQEFDDANKEVRQIATTLNVPEAVTKIAPAEGISDPKYQFYRPYFDARIKAKRAEMMVDGADKELSRIALEALLNP